MSAPLISVFISNYNHGRYLRQCFGGMLAQTYRTVNARLQALRFRSNFDERKWGIAVKEHERMVEKLAARDGPGLRALLVQHLENKRDAVLDQMQLGDQESA